MKAKVTHVVTMAHNDHRISVENDIVRVEITVKDTIKSSSPLLKLKQGDEIDLPFDGSVKANKSSKSKV